MNHFVLFSIQKITEKNTQKNGERARASERRARSLLARSLKNPESAARARSLAEKSSSVPLALARSRKFSEFLENWIKVIARIRILSKVNNNDFLSEFCLSNGEWRQAI